MKLLMEKSHEQFLLLQRGAKCELAVLHFVIFSVFSVPLVVD